MRCCAADAPSRGGACRPLRHLPPPGTGASILLPASRESRPPPSGTCSAWARCCCCWRSCCGGCSRAAGVGTSTEARRCRPPRLISWSCSGVSAGLGRCGDARAATQCLLGAQESIGSIHGAGRTSGASNGNSLVAAAAAAAAASRGRPCRSPRSGGRRQSRSRPNGERGCGGVECVGVCGGSGSRHRADKGIIRMHACRELMHTHATWPTCW